MFEQFLGKLRKFEIRMRKAVTSERHGNFHSVFKGSGLEFDDLRLYQYGDDVRAIDWNTSAKGHGTFIKIFKEDKEQTAFFMLDVSASQKIGEDRPTQIGRRQGNLWRADALGHSGSYKGRAPLLF